MFLSGTDYNYDVDKYLLDISLHSGIPKQYYSLKDKVFGDWEIPPWEIHIFKDRLLGEGGFSKVYLAKWRETFVVAKIINTEIIKTKKELVLREIDIMSKLHHPNIVQFLGYVDNPFILVMEYIPQGNLRDNISKLYKSQKITIMKDILKALAYFHNRKPHSLIHRDIKPTNVLLTNSKVAKITDFGLSKFYKLDNISSFDNLTNIETNNSLTKEVGTEKYMAPEILNREIYDNKIDIYACGILFFEMFENKRYVRGIDNSFWYTPYKLRNLIKDNMLNDDSTKRKTALELLKIINYII
jgi:serine/threonine protein kinase